MQIRYGTRYRISHPSLTFPSHRILVDNHTVVNDGIWAYRLTAGITYVLIKVGNVLLEVKRVQIFSYFTH